MTIHVVGSIEYKMKKGQKQLEFSKNEMTADNAAVKKTKTGLMIQIGSGINQ